MRDKFVNILASIKKVRFVREILRLLEPYQIADI